MGEVTIDKDILEKILDNEARSKENDAKVMIENAKTNRWVICVGVFCVCAVLVAWLLMPSEVVVDVENKSKSTIERIKE